MLTLTSLARADRQMLLNAGNDVQRWWRLVYTVLTGMVELLRVGLGTHLSASDSFTTTALYKFTYLLTYLLSK